VADLIRWHATAKDEAAEWPGRGAQESQIAAAAGGGEDEDGGDLTAGDDAPAETSKPSGTIG